MTITPLSEFRDIEDKYRWFYLLYACGLTVDEISEDYGVARAPVYRAFDKRGWLRFNFRKKHSGICECGRETDGHHTKCSRCISKHRKCTQCGKMFKSSGDLQCDSCRRPGRKPNTRYKNCTTCNKIFHGATLECGACRRYKESDYAKAQRRKQDLARLARVSANRKEAQGDPSRIVSWRNVAERDGLACWLCGELTDPTVNSEERRYPTVDHIHPISKGGPHTMENVKLAHRLCNLKRGGRG